MSFRTRFCSLWLAKHAESYRVWRDADLRARQLCRMRSAYEDLDSQPLEVEDEEDEEEPATQVFAFFAARCADAEPSSSPDAEPAVSLPSEAVSSNTSGGGSSAASAPQSGTSRDGPEAPKRPKSSLGRRASVEAAALQALLRARTFYRELDGVELEREASVDV